MIVVIHLTNVDKAQSNSIDFIFHQYIENRLLKLNHGKH